MAREFSAALILILTIHPILGCGSSANDGTETQVAVTADEFIEALARDVALLEAYDQRDAVARALLGEQPDASSLLLSMTAEFEEPWSAALEAGNLDAQFIHGRALVFDDTANFFVASEMIREAAEDGHAPSRFWMALRSRELGEDPSAVSWLAPAAESGHPASQALLGELLLDQSRATEEQLEEGMRFLVEAAEQGNRRALIRVIEEVRTNSFPDGPSLFEIRFEILQDATDELKREVADILDRAEQQDTARRLRTNSRVIE